MAATPPTPSSVPADPEQWSESSKRSYTVRPAHYEDIRFTCLRCGQTSVFTAEDQRETYEVRKAHIKVQRNLCATCFRERKQLEQRLQEYANRWQVERQTLSADRSFLEQWITLLEEHNRYGARHDAGNMRMVRSLLASLPNR